MLGSVSVLDGHAVVTHGDRILQADHIEYDKDSDEASLTGHLQLTGGENDERIQASHGTINVQTQVGRFYDVTGSVGMSLRPAANAAAVGQRAVYTNGNPFLFSGRLVVKTGPRSSAWMGRRRGRGTASSM
jgi:LPS-assembly protein